MKQTPSFRFSLSFAGKIWQTALDEVEGIWVLEVRESDAQRIRYHLLNLNSGEIVELPHIAEADWWTVILRFFHPILVLERYNDPQNPTDKDVILYHVEKKSILAVLHQFQFRELKDSVIFGHHPADQNDHKTFKLSRDEMDFRVNKKALIQYPSYFSPSSENMKLVCEYLKTDPSGVGCEYFESENHIIISYYIRWDRKFDRKLLVLSGDDELYHKIQDKELTGYASGAFFVFENLLVFVKNGNQIDGLEL